MPDKTYSDRELDERFSSHEELDLQRFNQLNEKLDDHFDASTNLQSEMLKEVKYTNGKVGEVVKWKEQTTGALKLAAFILPVFFSLLGFLAYKVIGIPQTVQAAVAQALIPYTK